MDEYEGKKPEMVTGRAAEDPIELRIARAYINGFSEGLMRGLDGSLDHR